MSLFSYKNSTFSDFSSNAAGLVSGLPSLNPIQKREKLETGTLKNGWEYEICQMTVEDAETVFALCEAEYNNPKNAGKEYLLYRSLADIRKMLTKGDPVLGVSVDGRLAAVGGVAPVADKGDMGRGKVYSASDCPPDQQLYFKMAVVHPELQEENLDFMKILYPHRLAKALKYETRSCLLTKTNHPKVRQAYAKNGWHEADQSEENGGILYTYKISNLDGLNWLQENRADVCHRHGLNGAFRQKLLLLAQAKQDITVAAANENTAPTPAQGFAPVYGPTPLGQPAF